MGFSIQHKIEVDWADLDLFGHVNNVAFFKYTQSTRVKLCETLGLTSVNETGKLSFLVASSHCDFKQPIFYPNSIIIAANITQVNNTSFVIEYELQNSNQQTVALAKDVLVMFDYSCHQKVLIDGNWRNRMEGGS